MFALSLNQCVCDSLSSHQQDNELEGGEMPSGVMTLKHLSHIMRKLRLKTSPGLLINAEMSSVVKEDPGLHVGAHQPEG